MVWLGVRIVDNVTEALAAATIGRPHPRRRLGQSGRSEMPRRLDAQSRGHLQAFAGQVGFLALIGLPVLLIDSHAPMLYLVQLRTMFDITGFVMLVIGVSERKQFSPTSLCIWDHCLAFILLKCGCSLALRLLG